MIHLTTSAKMDEAFPGMRLAVCFRAIGSTGPGVGETFGLPVERGTKNRADVTCPDCLTASEGVPVYRVQVEDENDCFWVTLGEFVDFEPASALAKAHRADGCKVRLKQPSPPPAPVSCSHCGLEGHVFCNRMVSP